MGLHLRSKEAPGDLEAMAALLSQFRPEPVSAAEIADRRSWLPEGSILQTLVAESGDGRFLGFAEAYRYPNTVAGKRSSCSPSRLLWRTAPAACTPDDSRNGPMLAVNGRLGYVPRSGTYEIIKRR